MTTMIVAGASAPTVSMAALTLLIVLALLVFLIQKEIVGIVQGELAQRLGRALSIAIVPLAVVFVCSTWVSVMDALR